MGCQCARYEEVNSQSLNNTYLEYIKSLISSYPVIVYSRTTCKRSIELKKLLDEKLIPYEYFEIGYLPNPKDVALALEDLTGRRKSPYVFLKGRFIGGLKKTKKEIDEGSFSLVKDSE